MTIEAAVIQASPQSPKERRIYPAGRKIVRVCCRMNAAFRRSAQVRPGSSCADFESRIADFKSETPYPPSLRYGAASVVSYGRDMGNKKPRMAPGL